MPLDRLFKFKLEIDFAFEELGAVKMELILGEVVQTLPVELLPPIIIIKLKGSAIL